MLDFGWEAYALLGAGLLFVVLEMLFPSGGLLGLGAAICLALGGWYSWQAGGGKTLTTYGLGVVVLAPLLALVTFRILPYTPMGKRIILSGPTFQDRKGTQRNLQELVGRQGEAMTPLRPSGIALIDGQRVDVITRGSHLEAGDPVAVVHVEGNRVIVERTSA